MKALLTAAANPVVAGNEDVIIAFEPPPRLSAPLL
jgi:hypothetical protein